jgi:DNA-binding winged helix-turn-helix (wHTH) protein/tetratricopeptide (TPR) repeat protein
MSQLASQPTAKRFGPFEVSPASRELRKHGVRIKLAGQPFDILAILLERGGEVVTREELRQRLWLADTFVDFEHGMNNAVKKLRAALGDSADHPLYIETLTRVGYRFIAPIEQIGSASNEAHVQSGMRWKVIAPAALVVVALASGSYFYFRHPLKLTDKDTIVLADFANTTGDAVFEGTLRQGLSVQLEQSPFLSLVSEPQIQQTLQMMGQNPDVKLTPEIARELCQRTGSSAVLDGSIGQVGTEYLLTVKAVNCVSGKTLASTEAQARDKNQVLDALGKTAAEMRNKLGESLSTVQKFDTPLEQATTPSLEALEAFSSGFRVVGTTGSAAGIPFFKHAVELDPNFALAYALLGRLYGDLKEYGVAADYARKAYELRERTSEPEKNFITSSYHVIVTGDMEKAEQTCELWAQAYPRSPAPHMFLSGLIYPVLGQHEKVLEEGKEAVRLNPDNPIPYSILMSSYIALNRLDEAKTTYEQALARKLSRPFYHARLYEIAFLQNDRAGMTEQVVWSTGKADVEDELLRLEANTAAYAGRLREAREFSRQAVDSAKRTGKRENAATHAALSNLREALFGNENEARKHATFALQGATGSDVEYCMALALAYAGDEGRLRALIDDLDKRFPEATIIQFNYLPTLRAKLAVSRGDTGGAIENLRVATPYELGRVKRD